jgi:hypothetical protein
MHSFHLPLQEGGYSAFKYLSALAPVNRTLASTCDVSTLTYVDAAVVTALSTFAWRYIAGLTLLVRLSRHRVSLNNFELVHAKTPCALSHRRL